MSGNIPTPTDDAIRSRIGDIERRLERAKELRENYRGVLGSYDNEADIGNAEGVDRRDVENLRNGDQRNARRPGLLERLETAQYFWDNNATESRTSVDALPVNNPVPGGLVLPTDMQSLSKRLSEIGQEVRKLREYKLTASTDVYFSSIQPQNEDKEFYHSKSTVDVASLADIRSRILNLEFNIEKRAREMLTEAGQRSRLKVEQHEQEAKILDLENKLLRQKLESIQKSAVVNMPATLGNVPQLSAEPTVPPVPAVPASATDREQPSLVARPMHDTNAHTSQPFPSISQSRTLVLPPTKLESTTTSQAKVNPKQDAESGGKSSYARMLDILRSPQNESSSSDEEPVIGGRRELNFLQPAPAKKPDSDSDSEFFK